MKSIDMLVTVNILAIFFLLSSCESWDEKPMVTYEIFDSSNSGMPTNFTTSLAFDNNSNLWIGTFNMGIVKYDGSTWTHYNTENSALSNDTIKDISVDRLNRVWVATREGVSMFDQEIWTTYTRYNSEMGGKSVLAIATDMQNNVWVSSTSKELEKSGLYFFDGTNWQLYNSENSVLPHYLVTALAVDNTNTLWVGAGMFQGRGGLIKVDGLPYEWKYYNTSNSPIKYNTVERISFSLSNDILISSTALYIFGSPNQWAGYAQSFDGNENWLDVSPANEKLNLTNRVTTSIYDNYNNIWIATIGDTFCIICFSALSKFDGEEWTVFSPANGYFPSTLILDIKVDDFNTLWIATSEHGLIKMAPD